MTRSDTNYAAVLKKINDINAAKHRRTHPLWIRLLGGELSRPQVVEFLRQFSVIPLYNHFFHGPLYVNCPNPKWRARMAEVVYEEGTGNLYSNGVPHWQLYLQMGEAFGISAEEMYTTEYGAGALAVRAYLTAICASSFLEGVAATALAGEAQVPGIAGKVSDIFVKHYGLTPEQAMFYAVHEEADRDHSEAGLEFLQEFAKTDMDLDLVVRTVRDCIEVSWAMYNDILQRIDAIG
ncbi:MAG: iron-containing redox enzyme family protein [Proteobacteria bacterium]|nr:iron-containing redox enzyme family protein [Pseudomonadota bacterium]